MQAAINTYIVNTHKYIYLRQGGANKKKFFTAASVKVNFELKFSWTKIIFFWFTFKLPNFDSNFMLTLKESMCRLRLCFKLQ